MSKFNKIFEARGDGSGKNSENTEESADKKKPSKHSKSTASSGEKSADSEKNRKPVIKAQSFEQSDSADMQQTAKKRGRPQAKRSDPSYLGFTTYIRRDTHLNAKIALLQEGKGRELSELVETLLADWLKSKSNS